MIARSAETKTTQTPAAVTASKAPFFGPAVQTKLRVNTPGDKYEVEADRVADRVVSTSASVFSGAGELSSPHPTTNTIQRQENIADQSDIQNDAVEETIPDEEQSKHREIAAISGAASPSDPPDETKSNIPDSVVSLISSSETGQPLNTSTRAFMESQMGENFSNVRIHTSVLAEQSAADINARAFTYGRDIAFGAGEYQPQTVSGKKLIAHELTHVVQQNNNVIRRKSYGVIYVDRHIMMEIPEISDIIQLYKKEFPSDKVLDLLIADIRKIFEYSLSGDPKGEFMAQYPGLRAKYSTLSPEQYALLFDCLKHFQMFGEAVEMMKKQGAPPNKTSFLHSEFYVNVLASDAGKWMSAEPEFEMFANRYVSTFRIFMLNPFTTADSLGLYKREEIFKRQIELKKNQRKSLVENERIYFFFETLDIADKIRKKILKQFESYEDRTSIAEKKVKHVSQLSNPTDELVAVLTRTDAKLQYQYSQINKFFTQAVSTYKGAEDKGYSFAQYQAIDSLIKKGLLLPFQANMEQAGQMMFQLSADRKVVSKDIYEKQVTSGADILIKVAKKIAADLPEKYADKSAESEAIVYWLFMNKLSGIYQFASKQASFDFSKENDRNLHRFYLAGQVYFQMKLFGFEKAADIAWQALKPQSDAVQKEVIIAFRADTSWKRKSSGSPETMLNEFNKALGTLTIVLDNGKKASSGSMAYEYKKIFEFALLLKKQRLLKEKIDSVRQVLPESTDKKDNYTPLINEVVKTIESENLSGTPGKVVTPVKYELNGIFFSAPPSLHADLIDTILTDPQYTAYFQKQFGSEHFSSILTEKDVFDIGQGLGHLDIWVLPEFKDIFDEFNVSLIEEHYNSMLKAEKGRLGAKNAAEKSAFEEDRNARKVELDAWVEDAEIRKNELMRQIYSHHRRMVIHRDVRSRIKEYDGLIRTGTYSYLREAATALDDVANHVSPNVKDEARLQMSAAIYELADVLNSKLGDLNDQATLNLIYYFGYYIAVAIETEKNIILESENLNLVFPIQEIQERTGILKKWKTRAIAWLHEFRSDSWLKGSKKNQSIHYNDTRSLHLNQPINHEGKMYTLEEVYTDFAFQEAQPFKTGAFLGDFSYLEKDMFGSRLKVNNYEINWRNRAGKTLLYRIKIDDLNTGNSTVTEVSDQHDHVLNETALAIIWHDFQVAMENLGEALETFGEWIKTPLYFIPGVNVAVMAADLIVGIIEFFNGGAYQLLKSVFGKDGNDIIAAAFEKIKDIFTIDGFWNAMLNDDFDLPTFGGEPAEASSHKQMINDEKLGKKDNLIKRMLKRFVSFGKLIYKGAARLKNFINIQVRGLRIFVLKIPILADALHYAATHYQWIRAMIGQAVDTYNNVKEHLSVFGAEINALIDSIRNFEVPHNMIKMDTIVEIIINLAVRIVGGKKGLKGMVVNGAMEVLKMAGIFDKVTKIIGDKLKTFVDPNIYLNEFIDNNISGKVKELTKGFADGASDFFNSIPFLKDARKNIKAPDDMNVTRHEDWEDDDVVAPMLKTGQNQPYRPSVDLSASGEGTALPEQKLLELAALTGQDFSHVRIHNDDAAHQASESVGALGLTTGNHIYLNNEVSADSQEGQSVINHELGHVLQHIGSRPIGSSVNNAATRNHTGGRINIDTHKETEADQFAKNVENGYATNWNPVAYDAELQPKVSERLFVKLLNNISAEDFQISKLTSIKIDVNAKFTPQDNTFKKQLHDSLNTVISNIKLPKKYNSKDTTSNERVLTGIQSVLTKSVEKLDYRHTILASKAGPAKSMEIKSRRLEILIVNAILKDSGILTDLKLNKDGSTVNQSNPILGMEIESVFLSPVNRTHNLWTEVITQTFETNKPFGLITKYKPDSLNHYKKAADVLLVFENDRSPMASGGFRFTKKFAQMIERFVHSEKKVKVPDGSSSDPVLINWYKNTQKDYPKKIDLLINGVKRSFSMDLSKNKEYDGYKFGVDPKYLVNKNYEMIRTSGDAKDERTSKIKKFRADLDKLDFKLKNMDADHVLDLAMGGDDSFDNYWPLNENINRIAYDGEWYKLYKILIVGKDGEIHVTNLSNLSTWNTKYGKNSEVHLKVKGFDHQAEDQTQTLL